MSLFNRKTFLDDEILSLSVHGISFDPIEVVTLGATSTGELTGSDAAAEAAAAGARSAAEATVASTEKNIEFQKWLWGEQKELTAPWVSAGADALTSYQEMMGKGFDYSQYKDPSTQFRFGEGARAVGASGAAKGMELSGRQAKELTRFGQDYASTEYGNAYSRWQNELSNRYNLAALGQASAAGQAAAGGAMGGRVGESILAGGRAQAGMYSDIGNIQAAQAMAPWQTMMDVGGLAASFYGGGKK